MWDLQLESIITWNLSNNSYDSSIPEDRRGILDQSHPGIKTLVPLLSHHNLPTQPTLPSGPGTCLIPKIGFSVCTLLQKQQTKYMYIYIFFCCSTSPQLREKCGYFLNVQIHKFWADIFNDISFIWGVFMLCFLIYYSLCCITCLLMILFVFGEGKFEYTALFN